MSESSELPSPVLPLNTGHGAVSSSWLNYCLALFALLILVVGSYWPSMHGEFLWDDDYYVTNNKALSRPGGMEQIWLGVTSPRTYPVPQFYPMTHTSFWLETLRHDWQEPLQSWPFHLINVLLHFASAWMLWTILRRLKCPGAFVAAAIWALHPVQVESVAWITERKNVLSAFFLFASLLVYFRFSGLDGMTDESSRGTFALPAERGKLYALALVLFVCSILSKSVTGSMPAIILVLIWWKRGQIKGSDFFPLIPFFVLALAMGITTSYFERNIVGAQGDDWNFTVIQRLLIAGGAVWFYALKLICPIKLAFVYPRWDLHSPLLAVALGSAAALIFWLYIAQKHIGRGPLAVAMLFVGSLFPALGFVNVFPMRYSFVADHFQYVACAALIAGAVWALHRFFTTPARFAVASGLILGALTAMTWSQNHIYTNDWTLWTDTLNKNPNAWIAHNNLGNIEREMPGMLDEAESHYRRALEIKPGMVLAIMNLGIVQQKRGNLDAAIELLKQAAEEAEKDPIHGSSYAIVYYNLGQIFHEKGNTQSAYYAYKTASDLDHHYLDALNAAGAMLSEQGDLKHAKPWFQRAIEIDPLFLPAHVNLGNLLLQEGDTQGALAEWGLVIEHDRNNVAAINSMGLLWAQMGKWDVAIAMFKRAMEINPNYEPAQKNYIAAVRHRQEAATQPTTTRSALAPTTR